MDCSVLLATNSYSPRASFSAYVLENKRISHELRVNENLEACKYGATLTFYEMFCSSLRRSPVHFVCVTGVLRVVSA